MQTSETSGAAEASTEILARPDLDQVLPRARVDMVEDARDHALVVQEVLAEPFPGTVAQGVVLVFPKESEALSFGQNRRAAQIRRLGVRGRREWVASIFAAVEVARFQHITDPVKRKD